MYINQLNNILESATSITSVYKQCQVKWMLEMRLYTNIRYV